jgi:SARP family transcriptional regulator, regulator of embCAB operon
MGTRGLPDLPATFPDGRRGAVGDRETVRSARDVLVRAHEWLSEPSIWHTEPEYAVRHATQAVNLEPFRETSYQLLMQAYAAVGNRAEALRAYERFRKLLSEELGVSPSVQTEAVYLDILRS